MEIFSQKAGENITAQEINVKSNTVLNAKISLSGSIYLIQPEFIINTTIHQREYNQAN